jgi:hypothetical protein
VKFENYALPSSRSRARHTPSRSKRPAGLGSQWWDRAALLSFGVLEVTALPVLLVSGRRLWFGLDDWDFLATRSGGNLGDLFRGHYGHWVTLPVLMYRLMWLLVGLRSYMPYQLLVIVAHLTAAALLRVVMRRAGVTAWVANIAAALFVFFGGGAENILQAFQITFVGALVFGLMQLLLADHDGPVDRRDWLGLGAGLAALMCSGVGVAMAVVVGVAVLMRRGWRLAMFHTAPLAAIYALWSATAAKGQSTAIYRPQTPAAVIEFVWIGLQATFGRLGQIPGGGVVLAVLLTTGLAIAYFSSRTEGSVRPTTPIALLAGAVVFLVLAAIYRSGNTFLTSGPAHAREGRYVYIVAALTLPALAVAANAIMRRWKQLAIPVAAMLLVGLPGNLHQLTTHHVSNAGTRRGILIAPRLAIALQLPRTLLIGNEFLGGGAPLGWLRDNVASGRIPSPGPTSPHEAATEALNLALQDTAGDAQRSFCRTLTGSAVIIVRNGESLTLKRGTANVVYLPGAEVQSLARPLPTNVTLVALAGPLRIRIVSTRGSVVSQATLCQ